MIDFDLSSILKGSSEQDQAEQQLLDQIQRTGEQQQQIQDQREAAVQRAGVASTNVLLAQKEAELATQNARLEVANNMGTNANETTDIISELATQMRKEAVQVLAAKKKVEGVERRATFGNPLGLVYDAVFGDQVRGQLDSAERQLQSTSDVMQRLNMATQQAAATANAISAPLTKAAIADTITVQSALNQEKLLMLKQEGLSYGLSLIESANRVGSQQFNRGVQMYQLARQEKEWQANYELRQAQFEEMQANRATRKQSEQDYLDATARINVSRASMNLPPVNTNYVKRVLMQPGEQGDDLRLQELMGYRTVDTGGVITLGITPSESYRNLARFNVDLPPSYEPSVKILNDSAEAVSAAQAHIATEGQPRPEGYVAPQLFGLNKGNVNNPKAVSLALDKAAKRVSEMAQSNVLSDDPANPYYAAPIPSVLQKNTVLAASNFGKQVLEPLVIAGKSEGSPEYVLAMSLTALKEGKVTLSEARDGITTFYEDAVAIKNSTAGFLAMGLDVQAGYKVTLPQFSEATKKAARISFGQILGAPVNVQQAAANQQARSVFSEPVDLTDPKAVTLILTLQRSQQIADQITKKAEKN